MSRCNFGSVKKFLVIFPAFFWAFLITGCDPNAKMKKRLTTDIEYIRTEIDKEIIQSHSILSELDGCKNKISDLEDRKSLKEVERTKCQYDFGKYILDHQTVILSIIPVGSEVVPLYCILHPTEWAEVTARIAWFSNKLTNIDDEIAIMDNRIYELKQKIGVLKQKYNGFEESIDALKARLSQKQEKINSF